MVQSLMRFRLRTLLILLAVGPPLLAVSYVVLQGFRHVTSYHIRATFGQVPDDDSQLTKWLSAQPNIKNVRVWRRPDPQVPERQRIEIYFQKLWPVLRGSPPDPNVDAAVQRLGYASPERALRDSW
jgi:hypothetical protein